MELTKRRCEACQVGAEPVSETQRKELLGRLPGWELTTIDDVPQLKKVFALSDYQTSLDFTVAVGAKAEENDHHPAILTEWGKVEVRWWTHKISNLHMNDFIMAAHTDEVYDQFKQA